MFDAPTMDNWIARMEKNTFFSRFHYARSVFHWNRYSHSNYLYTIRLPCHNGENGSKNLRGKTQKTHRAKLIWNTILRRQANRKTNVSCTFSVHFVRRMYLVQVHFYLFRDFKHVNHFIFRLHRSIHNLNSCIWSFLCKTYFTCKIAFLMRSESEWGWGTTGMLNGRWNPPNNKVRKIVKYAYLLRIIENAYDVICTESIWFHDVGSHSSTERCTNGLRCSR